MGADLTILVDMDGPLADFDGKFYALTDARGYLMHGGAVSGANPCEVHRFATDCIDDRRERDAAYREVAYTDWFRDLPPTIGAIEGINLLADHPDVADVYICTKPMERNRLCRDAKADWVRRHLGREWERRLILSPDKGMVRGDILLDDAPKSEWFARAEWSPVIYRTPWNAPGASYCGKHGLESAPRWDWADPLEGLVAYAATVKVMRSAVLDETVEVLA